MDRPPVEGGFVTISGDRIVDAGLRPHGGARIDDLGDVALLPGLINAHTHLEFSDLAQPLGRPGMNFVEWIRLVIARRSTDATHQAAAVAKGMRECLAAGVTTVCDITTADASVYADLPPGPDVVAFLEVIGFSQARAVSALAAAEDRLRTSQAVVLSAPHVVKIGLSPHAPYTVNLRLLLRLVHLARKNDVPLAMHIAESPDELELLLSRSGPFRDLLEERSMWDEDSLTARGKPFDYLLHLALAPRWLVIHGLHLAEKEVQWLVQCHSRGSLVFCPRTHAYFNGNRYPLENRLRAGIRVVLGTDSRASTPDLSVLNEARHAAAEHPKVAPYRFLEMATLNAAEALGLSESVGSITPGKLANLTAIPLDPRHTAPPAEAIVETTAPPQATWYRGRLIASLE
jgi:cytosine/adenosine deaminase-related metal-dependent hydrolase